MKLHWLGTAAALGGCIAVASCGHPSDVVVEPPGFTPLQDQAGRFRVTFGDGQDVVRGFLPGGRLVFRTFGLEPFGPAWILASAPLDGTGVVREEAAVYRPAIFDRVGTLTTDSIQRVLTFWRQAAPGQDGCPDSSMTVLGSPGPAPRTPSPVALIVYVLSAADGVPISSLPVRAIRVPTVIGAGTDQQRVRVGPAVREADRLGSNPFGPVLMDGSASVIYSDGDQLWQASLVDTSLPPTPVGTGAYPALSPDRQTLAYARPVGIDSTVQTYTIPLGFAVCVEEFVEVRAGSWEIVLRDLGTGTERVLSPGREPVFDPLASRLVARGSGLVWVDLDTGVETPITATAGAFAPAVAPDGSLVAFSLANPGSGPDVYFLPINR